MGLVEGGTDDTLTAVARTMLDVAVETPAADGVAVDGSSTGWLGSVGRTTVTLAAVACPPCPAVVAIVVFAFAFSRAATALPSTIACGAAESKSVVDAWVALVLASVADWAAIAAACAVCRLWTAQRLNLPPCPDPVGEESATGCPALSDWGADASCGADGSVAALLVVWLCPELVEVDELLAKLLDGVAFDGTPFDEEKFDEVSVDDVSSDVLAFELFDGLVVDPSDMLAGSEACESLVDCPARCSASSKPPNELSADDDAVAEGVCPTGG